MNSARTARIASLLFCLSLSPIHGIVSAEVQKTPKKSEPKKTAIAWKEFDASKFGAKLSKASTAKEKWAASPESIILEYAGPFISKDGEKAAQSRTIRIHSKGEGLPKALNVILIDDGLFDDSIKTTRTRLTLARAGDGSWKLRKASRSQEKWKRP